MCVSHDGGGAAGGGRAGAASSAAAPSPVRRGFTVALQGLTAQAAKPLEVSSGAVAAARATATAARRAARLRLEGAAERLRAQKERAGKEVEATRRRAEREIKQLQRWRDARPWERRASSGGGGSSSAAGAVMGAAAATTAAAAAAGAFGAAAGATSGAGAGTLALGARLPRPSSLPSVLDAPAAAAMTESKTPSHQGEPAFVLDDFVKRAAQGTSERLEEAVRAARTAAARSKAACARHDEQRQDDSTPSTQTHTQAQAQAEGAAQQGGKAAQDAAALENAPGDRNPLRKLQHQVDRVRARVDRAMAQQQEERRLRREAREGGWEDDVKRTPPRVLARAMALLPFTPRSRSLQRRVAEAQAADEDDASPRRAATRRPPPPSDLSESKVAIVTTASLPWMTGTAVNPLLRTAFLARRGTKVSLVVPWLGRADQERVYPNALVFETPRAQEEWIRDWLARRVGFEADFNIHFYPGRYSKEYGSILADGDITSFIPEGSADVAVLEEPEHLNWYHHGERWTNRFSHVVGVMHTNYLEYARHEKGGRWKALSLRYINKWVCRSYCDKVIKLSDAVQPLPRSITTNVHGVCPHFLAIGDTCSKLAAGGGEEAYFKGAYFVGKALWSKGYRELLDLMHVQRQRDGAAFELDAFGGGEDKEAVAALAKERELDVRMLGPLDHAHERVHGYKVFVNPSESDVLCTCTAEALAMGKFAVLKDNPSNQFFKNFPNAYLYSTPEEFSSHVAHCLAAQPEPLQAEHRHMLTWEAATERFLEAAAPGHGDGRVAPDSLQPAHVRALDGAFAKAHWAMGCSERIRRAAGAMPNSSQLSVEQALDLGVALPEGPDAVVVRPE